AETDPPSPLPETENLSQRTAAVLLSPAPPAQSQKNAGWWWLGLTLVLFVLSIWAGHSFHQVLLIVAVLFFHESGHYLGMLWFGYRDLQMFFIPFFGAAVYGRKEGAPHWHHAPPLPPRPPPAPL